MLYIQNKYPLKFCTVARYNQQSKFYEYDTGDQCTVKIYNLIVVEILYKESHLMICDDQFLLSLNYNLFQVTKHLMIPK